MMFDAISDCNVNTLIGYIRAFGIMAPLIAFFLFTFQAAFPIFPYIVLAVASGIVFGFKIGFLLAWLGALAGACIAYWLCSLVARDWILLKIRTYLGYDLNQLNPEIAFWTIVIARIIPIVPTPAINAAAALGGVSFRNFLLSSAIGKIPTAALYTGLGICLFQVQDIKIGLLILAIILALAGLGRYTIKKHNFNLPSRSSS
ncbi:MAG: TVP38/TMEM64 family protein [Syntrophomonadaceae bacterium]|jgi:uncharacterized membrane protein YdjX (TVP38/TMEM64 family)